MAADLAALSLRLLAASLRTRVLSDAEAVEAAAMLDAVADGIQPRPPVFTFSDGDSDGQYGDDR